MNMFWFIFCRVCNFSEDSYSRFLATNQPKRHIYLARSLRRFRVIFNGVVIDWLLLQMVECYSMLLFRYVWLILSLYFIIYNCNWLMRHTNGKIHVCFCQSYGKYSIEPHFGRFDWFLWDSIHLSFILFTNSWIHDAMNLLNRPSQLECARCNRC